MNFIFFVVGLVLIIKSADILIDSTSKIAAKYGVSTFIVGITVIAFGTSAPEFVVGLVSGIKGTNQLTLGDVVGSSIVNIALITGLSAAIFPLAVKDTTAKREIPILIFVQSMLILMLLTDGKISRLEGGILLLGFAGFMAYIIRSSKKSLSVTYDSEETPDTADYGNMAPANAEEPIENNMKKLWLLSAFSLIGLFIGGRLAVESSTKIAGILGMSETLIGLTVVAVSTSLPELITSIVAVKKKEADIILGNCIGSNIFNTLWVLGLSSVINPISAQGDMTLDVSYMLLLTLLLFVIALFAKRVPRIFGIIFMASYIAYVAINIMLFLIYSAAV